MTFDSAATLGILTFAIILFLSEKLRPDLIAMLTTALLAGFGVISAQESFSGFSSKAVIIIISVFILAEGLSRTGVSELIAGYLIRWGGKRESTLVALFMGAGGILSLFINNVAAAAVLIPSAGTASRRSRFPVSKLLIPLVFATIMGGMATLLTTMNIVVGTVLEKNNLPGFGLLDFLPVGIPMLAAGIVYMVFWGRHRLPSRSPQAESCSNDIDTLFGLYEMNELFFCAKIPDGSYLAGKKLSQSILREEFGLNLIAVTRNGVRLSIPSADTVLQKGDILTLKGIADDFKTKDKEPKLELLSHSCITRKDVESAGTILAEVMLSPRSNLIDSTIVDSMFMQKYGMNVIAVWREGEPIRRGIKNMKLKFGDALLGIIPEEKLRLLRDDTDLIPLTPVTRAYPAKIKAPVAIAVIAATLIAVIFTNLPMSQVFFAGAVAMLLTKVVTMQQAYRAIDWRAVFLVAGMLPMALAMQKSGVAESASSLLISGIGKANPLIIVAVLFLLSAALAQAVSGAAVAAIMAPIAVSATIASGAPAHALGMAVALGSSMAFLTPLGHPVNIMVMGAGGYRFRDYRRVGVPLFVILTIVAMVTFTIRWNLLQI